MNERKTGYKRDGDETDSDELEGAVQSNTPDPSVKPWRPTTPPSPIADGNSPDGEEG